MEQLHDATTNHRRKNHMKKPGFLRTKHIAATHTKGAKIRVTSTDWGQKTFPYAYEADNAHHHAAAAFAEYWGLNIGPHQCGGRGYLYPVTGY